MGKEIVYCGGCGKSLREDEFTKGKAHTVDNRPFCIECKPIGDSHPAPSQIQPSSKLPGVSKLSSTRAIPVVPPSTRRHRTDISSKAPFLIGAALVGVALIGLILFVSAPGGRSPEPEPYRPPPAPVPRVAVPPSPPPGPAVPDRAAAAFKELEAFVATSPPPVALLQRCDEARAAVQGTPFEARVKAIEERARDAHRSLQVDSAFEEVKKLRESDREYERKEEVLGLLNATLPMSGPRRGEVETLIASYRKDAEAFEKKPPAPPAPPKPAPAPKPAKPVPPPVVSTGSLGPFETDSHGGVNHWLVLGPFANRNDRAGLNDHDLLGTELAHVPEGGLQVQTREAAKVRWTPIVVSEGRLLFRQVEGAGPEWKSPQPAIAFAACWLVADNDVDVKFRTNADRGYVLVMDHKRIRNQAAGVSLSEPADAIVLKLTKGPHLLVFKVATTDELFGLRFRVSTSSGDRIPGIRVWNQPPGSRKLLYSETFNAGRGAFQGGEIVDGGVDGTKAYAIVHPRGVVVEAPFKSPATAETTVRVKIKPLFDAKLIKAMLWSNVHSKNCWYHLPVLKKDEWNVVEFKVAAVRVGYKMEGPSLEGETPARLTFYFEDKTADARILIDDFEILE